MLAPKEAESVIQNMGENFSLDDRDIIFQDQTGLFEINPGDKYVWYDYDGAEFDSGEEKPIAGRRTVLFNYVMRIPNTNMSERDVQEYFEQ